MTFSLTDAPPCFQRALDVIPTNYNWKPCLLFLDYDKVFLNNVDNHIQHFDAILTILHELGVTLKRTTSEPILTPNYWAGLNIKPNHLGRTSYLRSRPPLRVGPVYWRAYVRLRLPTRQIDVSSTIRPLPFETTRPARNEAHADVFRTSGRLQTQVKELSPWHNVSNE